jgi:putative glutamine amidotransferase
MQQPRSAPVIGIEVDVAATESGRRYAKGYLSYVDAVLAAGGVPLLVPPMPQDALERAVALLDGVLVPGGDDIAAEEWGEVQRACPRFVAVDAARLEHGKRLLRLALDQGLPVLGVCYGAQLLNLVAGGTMVQDIADEHPAALDHRAGTHDITLEPGSLLRRVLGRPTTTVNSRHHQSNREPGPGLVVSARAPDGVVEAVEGTDASRFVLGVQWHPEEFGQEGSRLIDAFVEAARARALRT